MSSMNRSSGGAGTWPNVFHGLSVADECLRCLVIARGPARPQLCAYIRRACPLERAMHNEERPASVRLPRRIRRHYRNGASRLHSMDRPCPTEFTKLLIEDLFDTNGRGATTGRRWAKGLTELLLDQLDHPACEWAAAGVAGIWVLNEFTTPYSLAGQERSFVGNAGRPGAFGSGDPMSRDYRSVLRANRGLDG